MKLETKTAFWTTFMLVALGAGSVMSAIHKVAPAHAAVSTAGMRQVMIPVAGVVPAALSDTWGTARGEGRRHEGIDIMAPTGTPVHAATAGTIAKLYRSGRGGIAIYQFDPSERFILYYAHLDGYAQGLKEGMRVGQGQLIGYVGSTGNATTPHLHFEIQRVRDAAGKWWRGDALNPYQPLLSGRIG